VPAKQGYTPDLFFHALIVVFVFFDSNVVSLGEEPPTQAASSNNGNVVAKILLF
jgi:hypothetical protein